MAIDVRKEVVEAKRRIAPHVRETPVELSASLGAEGSCRVHLKLENLQRTGSFKFRGAMNKLLSLNQAERDLGVVAASTGNHGAAVACAASTIGCVASIFVPRTAEPSKVEAIRRYGGQVREVRGDCRRSLQRGTTHDQMA